MSTPPKSFEKKSSSTSTCINKFPFVSERLRIRRLKDEDMTALYAYRNDEEVAKYQSWTDKSKRQIQALIDEKPTLDTVNEWFTFAIALKDTDKLIGECAFCINEKFPQQAEIGITLSRESQGNGYASEAITAILNFLFATTKIENIIFITYIDNTSCINLICKLNTSHRINHEEMIDNMKFNHYGLKENEAIFSISKLEWQQKQKD